MLLHIHIFRKGSHRKFYLQHPKTKYDNHPSRRVGISRLFSFAASSNISVLLYVSTQLPDAGFTAVLLTYTETQIQGQGVMDHIVSAT